MRQAQAEQPEKQPRKSQLCQLWTDSPSFIHIDDNTAVLKLATNSK